MTIRPKSSRYYRLASALGLALVIAGCTKGGQFDPTELINNDMFETKKKLKGDREALFPAGVPGTTTGVPPDLVKGYQAPPEAADADATAPAPAPEAAKPKPKPKLEPKPKVAVQKPAAPAAPASTRISIGPASKPAAGDQQAAPWPSPAQPAAQNDPAWPSPNQAPSQQAAQPSQSIWPAAPAPRTTTQ